jgi:hypothetical protein
MLFFCYKPDASDFTGAPNRPFRVAGGGNKCLSINLPKKSRVLRTRLFLINPHFDESKAISHDELVQSAAAKAGFKIGKAIFGWAISKTLEANGLSMLAAII